MTFYADTSFLLSLYVPDLFARRAIAAMKAAARPLLLTQFAELEFINALQLRRFRKEMTAAEAETVWSDFQSDIAGGVLSTLTMPGEVYAVGIRLAREHSATIGSRSLDLLHVATALQLNAEAFYTFDRRQALIAHREGLKTLQHTT